MKEKGVSRAVSENQEKDKILDQEKELNNKDLLSQQKKK